MSMDPALYSVVERTTNFRDYTYRAFINRKTKRLYKIRAGCRTWRTFTEAHEHYRSDAEGGNWNRSHTPAFNVTESTRMAIEHKRLEAIALLNRLERDVRHRIRRLRANA